MSLFQSPSAPMSPEDHTDHTMEWSVPWWRRLQSDYNRKNNLNGPSESIFHGRRGGSARGASQHDLGGTEGYLERATLFIDSAAAMDSQSSSGSKLMNFVSGSSEDSREGVLDHTPPYSFHAERPASPFQSPFDAPMSPEDHTDHTPPASFHEEPASPFHSPFDAPMSPEDHTDHTTESGFRGGGGRGDGSTNSQSPDYNRNPVTVNIYGGHGGDGGASQHGLGGPGGSGEGATLYTDMVDTVNLNQYQCQNSGCQHTLLAIPAHLTAALIARSLPGSPELRLQTPFNPGIQAQASGPHMHMHIMFDLSSTIPLLLLIYKFRWFLQSRLYLAL